MAIKEIPYSHQKLNEFAATQWDKTLAFLQNRYGLSRTDCEDIFQDAFITLHNNISEGKLTKLTSSLSTYFNAICINKAKEKMRGMGRTVNIIDDNPNGTKDEFEDERIDRLLALEEDTLLMETHKEAIVREIVSKLPDPCDKILWGFYRDGFSMKTLAQMHNYASEGSVKVIKHRCAEKFKIRFLELSKRFFD